MQIFRAPKLINDAISCMSAWFSRDTATETRSDSVIIVPEPPNNDLPEISRRLRHWRACGEEPSDTLVSAVRSGFDVLGGFHDQRINEPSTGSIVIDPILVALGYWPWIEQIGINGNIPDYQLSTEVALEIKRACPNYDQIMGPNPTQRFSTIAHQLVTYLDELKFQTMLYSNGSFWWRIERDFDSSELHALRFNMRLAFNEIRNQQSTEHLRRFAPLFHASAFRMGNNYSIPIRQGLGQRIQPFDRVGLVWTKDLNNGFRNDGF
jgi:hypothetical protein